MKFSMSELNKLRKTADKNIEDQINFNILNFIHTIHLNADDFIEMSYNSKFFGDLEMIFKKKSGQVMGLIIATFDGEIRKYVFNDKGMNC
jgi:hypothetical protein